MCHRAPVRTGHPYGREHKAPILRIQYIHARAPPAPREGARSTAQDGVAFRLLLGVVFWFSHTDTFVDDDVATRHRGVRGDHGYRNMQLTKAPTATRLLQ